MGETTQTALGLLHIPEGERFPYSEETLEAERAIPPLEIAYTTAELKWINLMTRAGREPLWNYLPGNVRNYNEKRVALEAAAHSARAELDDVSELLRDARGRHSSLVRRDERESRIAKDRARAEEEAAARAERHRANESRTATLLKKFGLLDE